jgi:hypothetical protein
LQLHQMREARRFTLSHACVAPLINSVKQACVLLQVLLTASAEVSSLRDTEPYAAAQRLLDGFLESTVNSPLTGNLCSDSAAARTEGTSWNIPTTAPPAGEWLIWPTEPNSLAH